MSNYFNTLTLREKLEQLGKCRFMDASEFEDGVTALKDKKIVIVGCGAQGLNQGLNMRDSGLDISYTLRQAAIDQKRDSYVNATSNDFKVGTYEDLLPTADVVINLTPDKQHTNVVKTIMPLLKKGATLSYSHGFNIVEEGMQIREDLTVIMVAPKCPGSEVREEYKKDFNYPFEDQGGSNFINDHEPYYAFLWSMKELGCKFDYLYPFFDDRFKSTNPRLEKDSEDIGIHMWYTRQWNSNMDVWGLPNVERYNLVEKYISELYEV